MSYASSNCCGGSSSDDLAPPKLFRRACHPPMRDRPGIPHGAHLAERVFELALLLFHLEVFFNHFLKRLFQLIYVGLPYLPNPTPLIEIDGLLRGHISSGCGEPSKSSEACKLCQCNKIAQQRAPFAARNPRSVPIPAFWRKPLPQ